MRTVTMIAGVMLVLAAVPASAKDRTGFTAIAAGDLATAERTLTAERRVFPDRPELMLNLAAVYGRTGRDAEARALYRAVLDRPAAAMDVPSGAVMSSHDLANAGLARVTVERVATR